MSRGAASAHAPGWTRKGERKKNGLERCKEPRAPACGGPDESGIRYGVGREFREQRRAQGAGVVSPDQPFECLL